MMKKTLSEEIFTIPNIMSFFRLLLIPAIILLYCKYDKPVEAALVIILSGVTDITDGRIARKFNMVTDVGKVLDPVADKLTQLAMMVCLIHRDYWMSALILLLAVKELLQLAEGCMVLKSTGKLGSSRWYGKLSTAALYAGMTALFLFPHMPALYVRLIILLCAAALTLSMALYTRFNFMQIKAQQGGSEPSY